MRTPPLHGPPGCRSRRSTTTAFAVAGLCVAITGILVAGFDQTVNLQVSGTFTFDVIAAILVGGTAVSSSRGSIVQSAIGAVVISVIYDILLLRGASTACRFSSKAWSSSWSSCSCISHAVREEFVSVHDEVRALRAPLPRHVRTVMPYVLLATLIVVLFVMPRLYGKTVSIFNVYDSLQYWSAYGLVALGLGLTMIAGEFDFSVLGIFAACPMIAVKVGEHGALLGLVVALGIAAVVGFLEGVIIARLRINSMAVTLGFYIALLGVSVTIANDETVSYSDYNVGSMLDATKLRILSWSSIIAIVVFAIVVVVMHYTHIGRDVRAVGGDRRASRTVGVEVDRVLIGVFVTSAVCSALGGVLLAYSLATAVPDPA